MKYKIFYIDDQSFALPQLIHAIPNWIDYELIYVQRIQDIIIDDYFIVILDFYLDKDHKTALDIVEKFESSIIMSFSTSDGKNNLMCQKYADYWVKKLKWTNKNAELLKIMWKVFNR